MSSLLTRSVLTTPGLDTIIYAIKDPAGVPVEGKMALSELSGLYATAAQGALADSAVQPGDLATVATTGDYGDLSGTPTLGTLATLNSPLPIANGGSGATAQQAAIDALTAVAAATNEYVLTKDTVSGNAVWKVASGGAALTVQEVDGAPSVANVDTIVVSNGTLTDDGGGQVTITTGGGSSLPVADTQTIVMGSADNTKLLRFEVDGFTAGATRILTPPNADAMIAGLEVAQNFTANQGFGITPTAQVEIQSSDVGKRSLIVRAPAGATGDIIQAYDKDGNLGFTFDRFSRFIINFGLDITIANSGNLAFTTSSSSTIGNIQIQSREVGNLPLRVAAISAGNIVGTALVLAHNRSSGTPSTAFGCGLIFQGESTTTEFTQMGRFYTIWNVATHASRVADIVAEASYSGGASEIWRGRAGASPLFAVLGATPVARQAHIVDPSGGGTQDAEARTAINAILVALENFGFLATS